MSVKRARSGSDEECKQPRPPQRSGLVGIPMPDGLMARIDTYNSRVEILDAQRTVLFDEKGIYSYFIVGNALFFTTCDGLNVWSKMLNRQHVSADGHSTSFLSGAVVTPDNCLVTSDGMCTALLPTMRMSTKQSLDLNTSIICWWHEGPVLFSMCLDDNIVHSFHVGSNIIAIVPDGTLCNVKLEHTALWVEHGSEVFILMDSPFPFLHDSMTVQVSETTQWKLTSPVMYLHGNISKSGNTGVVFGVNEQHCICTISYKKQV